MGFIDRLVRFPYPCEVIKKTEIAGHVCCVCVLLLLFFYIQVAECVLEVNIHPIDAVTL